MRLMHELGVTREILGIVLRHAAVHAVERVVTINLAVSALSDLQAEWLQRYFDHLSRGTAAEGARLQINRRAIEMLCGSCGAGFTIDPGDLADEPECPQCGGSSVSLAQAPSFTVENMEAL